jgi:alpha-methylacyl-CoA racemase
MVHADFKTDPGRELALGLAEHAATSIEGMRPGVAERRGVGPAQCLARTIAQDLLGDVLASWLAQ